MARFSINRFKCMLISLFFPLWEILECVVCAFMLHKKQEQVLSSVMFRCFQVDMLFDFRRNCKLSIRIYQIMKGLMSGRDVESILIKRLCTASKTSYLNQCQQDCFKKPKGLFFTKPMFPDQKLPEQFPALAR